MFRIPVFWRYQFQIANEIDNMIIPVFVSIVNLGHLTKVVSLIPAYGEVYLIQHYGIKFVSDLQYVSSFLCVLRFPPPVKLTATTYCRKWH